MAKDWGFSFLSRAMDSKSKRRRLNPPPRRTKKTDVSTTGSFPKAHSSLRTLRSKKTDVPTTGSCPMVDPAQSGGYHFDIQQARNFAVSQAQQEGSVGNFILFDSSYGNFMIPAVPTRAELSDC